MNALILIDIQNDFLPGGALAVSESDAIIPIVNKLQRLPFECVVATQDWHPADHGSFAANHPGAHIGDAIVLHGIRQLLWPVHCVQHTHGAAFAPALEQKNIAHIVQKGTDSTVDSYSGFFDNNHRHATGLEHYLRHRGIRRVFIVGLATDYCVKFTALDALSLGFETYVVVDACRGVDISPGDVDRALHDIEITGGHLIRANHVSTVL